MSSQAWSGPVDWFPRTAAFWIWFCRWRCTGRSPLTGSQCSRPAPSSFVPCWACKGWPGCCTAGDSCARRRFLQMAAFCMFVCVYFLEPSLAASNTPAARENQQLLARLPSYRFLGLFQGLNGSMHTTMAPLARRALTGLAVAVLGAGAAFLFSYFRTLRKIVEEPDFAAGSRGANWSPRFGNSLDTAVVLFSIRTLLRSRQHRVILAFYLGVGFAIIILLIKAPNQRDLSTKGYGPAMFASIVMMLVWIAGTRIVFSLPLDLRANWIFRVTQVRSVPEYIAASRRPLFVLAMAPVWVMCV